MSTRNDMIERILNLRALGEGTNSEAEAAAAMRAADKLMRGYRIGEAELAMAEADGSVRIDITEAYQGGIMQGRHRHKVQACLWAIEHFCEVEAVITSRMGKCMIHWIGDRPDVELAQWFVDLVRGALDREYENWKRAQVVVGRGAKASFQTAMAARINSRLREMRKERDAERASAVADATRLLPQDEADRVRYAVSNGNIRELTSTALVVASAAQIKHREVQGAFKAAYAGSRLGRAKNFSGGRNGNAFSAGQAAGDRVNFGRPVSNSRVGLLQ